MDDAAEAPASAPAPAAEAPPPPTGDVPVREAVLAGRFIGAKAAGVAEALTAFIAEGGLAAWFGRDAALRLAGDPDRLRAALNRDIAAIDAMLSDQVDAILHHPRLRRLEGTWRGVRWLLDAYEASARVKVRLLQLPWPELCRDLERAAEFDQSQLFKKIYEDEFGTPGGEPYGLLVVDHEVRHRPGPGAPTDDVTTLGLLASVAAAAFAPLVVSASPTLLELDEFDDIVGVLDPAVPLRNPEHARWRALSQREDMRFVAVTLPRFLARLPWSDDGSRVDGWRYAEHAPDAASRVWSTAGYAFAACAARAYAQFAWPADVRGVETDRVAGGLVQGLPIESFRTDPPHVAVRTPVDVVLSDRQERALVEGGLMPMGALPWTEEAVFSSVRSLQQPRAYQSAPGDRRGAVATANARISAQLNAMLCVSRFAHYIKVMGRDMVGSYRDANTIEMEVQRWLMRYVNISSVGSPDLLARHPLAQARVTVKEKPGQPGVYGCTIHLQPHFQLDDVSATFRLVTDLTGVRAP